MSIPRSVDSDPRPLVASHVGIDEEAAARRTFAIISHPDAGKSTLTEKLLLYAGAITEAGSIKARPGRHGTVSDRMDMERQRGISVASTVLGFTHRRHRLNLVDMPGHADFSEDTYRVLTAVDAALMVLDAAKGVEERTLKLFQVCRARNIPLLTFVNKFDRPSLAPLQIIDEIEASIGVRCAPLTWPVGDGTDFRGVIDRSTGQLMSFARTAGGRTRGEAEEPVITTADDRLVDQAREECELLERVGANLDRRTFLAGESTPVSRLAFVRVCSGAFVKGDELTDATSGRRFTANHVHEVFGRERHEVDRAVPGDVIALSNARDVRLGDTLFSSQPTRFPPIPSFAPEWFAVARVKDMSMHKRFHQALRYLDEEGTVQVLHALDRERRDPVLGAVGTMQFEVAVHRLRQEFGVEMDLGAIHAGIAMTTDEEGADRLRSVRNVEILRRRDGTILAVFPNAFWAERIRGDHPEIWLEGSSITS